VEKDKDHRSSLYDDAWMPHMLRITWNGIALHGGPLPGYAVVLSQVPPLRTRLDRRLPALSSLPIWIAVAACGRSIAYF
jgi:hypothetical protein